MGRYLAPLQSKHPANGWMHIGKNGMKRRLPRMTAGRVAIPALLAVATAACTVGPNIVRPETAHGSAYTKSAPSAESTTSVTFGGEVAEDWYELFHSDALNDLVRQALVGNPDLEAARHGLMAAQFELKAVAGTALPQIDATGQVGRARVNGSFLNGPDCAKSRLPAGRARSRPGGRLARFGVRHRADPDLRRRLCAPNLVGTQAFAADGGLASDA
jgi:hypothetical protein